MSLVVRFENKGLSKLIDTDGEHATLDCDFASPPGSPLLGNILGSNQPLQLKVRDCRRSLTNPMQYQLRGRWVNLSRAGREELLGSLADNTDL